MIYAFKKGIATNSNIFAQRTQVGFSITIKGNRYLVQTELHINEKINKLAEASEIFVLFFSKMMNGNQ